MKTSTIAIVIFFITLLAGGCVSTPPNLTPANDLSVHTNFLGFSIQLPDGPDWFVQNQGFNWITYIKLTAHKEKHTVIAMAMSQAVDMTPESTKNFLGYVEKTNKIEKSDSRYRAVNQKISSLIIDRAECVRVDFTAEDHGVPYALGSNYILQGFDIFCLHPDSPHMLVRFGYSQRFEKGITPLVLENEINKFVISFTFNNKMQNRFSIGPLLGVYAYDKSIFFPDGHDLNRERLLMSALKEGDCKDAEIYTPSLASEEMMAPEYDGVWWAVSNGTIVYPALGCILGKVGRWNEAFEAFRATSLNNSQSAVIMGNIGVALHAAGRFKDSAEYFRKANTLEPDYFEKKIQQKRIFIASEKGVSAK